MSVIKFYPKNAGDNPDMVLEQAIGLYEDVLLIGYNKDDYVSWRISKSMSKGDLLWLLENIKYKLLSGEL